MPIKEGEKAPDFTLKANDDKEYKLSDLKGHKVVLAFYPLDFSPVCSKEHACFVDDLKQFDTLGARVFGISVDSVWAHKAFAEKHGLPFTLLADPDKAVTKEYGVLKTYMGVMEMARRDTFLIDPDGKVAKHYESVEPEGHSQVVLDDIKALKAAKKTG